MTQLQVGDRVQIPRRWDETFKRWIPVRPGAITEILQDDDLYIARAQLDDGAIVDAPVSAWEQHQ